ncbi:MAG: hypothetical protein HKO65_01895 [Gemmatimonadetes bacterium]|nr:hypothetical protein [Gemmatimonadota bacterium]NNM03828.1 hypothetical protein [Gemmatimonadota bacterium]
MPKIRTVSRVLAVCVLASACGSSTEPEPDPLVGRWLAQELQIDGVSRDLSSPAANGLGQLDLFDNGEARVWFWFDGHLSPIPFPHEWRKEGALLFIGADLELQSEFTPSFSVSKADLVLTFFPSPEVGDRIEVWTYSRVTP